MRLIARWSFGLGADQSSGSVVFDPVPTTALLCHLQSRPGLFGLRFSAGRPTSKFSSLDRRKVLRWSLVRPLVFARQEPLPWCRANECVAYIANNGVFLLRDLGCWTPLFAGRRTSKKRIGGRSRFPSYATIRSRCAPSDPIFADPMLFGITQFPTSTTK